MIKEVPCAFCGANVIGRLFVVCGSCDVPMHHDCWAVAATCPAYGCGSAAAVDPAIALFRRTTAPVAVEPAPVVTKEAVRLERLDRMIATTEASLRPYTRMFIASFVFGGLGIALGVKLVSAKLIFLAIAVLTGGSLATAIGSGEGARRLQMARDERDRIMLEMS